MKVRQLVYIAIFAALTAVCSQISFPIPFTTVPFSMSLLAVFLCGAILSPLEAFAAQAVYLLLGAVGLPVYATFTGGVGILFGMTGGYLFSYALMAPLVALFAKKGKKLLFLRLLGGMALSLLLCYTLGTFWFMLVSGSELVPALSACVLPFVIPDVIKIGITAGLAILLRSALRASGLYEAA